METSSTTQDQHALTQVEGGDPQPVRARPFWGQHMVATFYDCDPHAIRDPEVVREFLEALVPAIEMVAYKDPNIVRFGQGEIEGLTCVQLIETSSITFVAPVVTFTTGHFDETENRRLFFDLFSCRRFNEDTAVTLAHKFFGGKADYVVLQRR